MIQPVSRATVAVFIALTSIAAANAAEKMRDGGGALLFAAEPPGKPVPAPLLGAEADIRVTGSIARVVIRQSYINPSSSWLEARYVFPLPETASVDRMRITSGETELIAEIHERDAARRGFQAAKQAGKRAALVEQHRPNVFSTDLANIAPRAIVTVEISYLQQVRYDQGKFSLRFPMVVAPRYTPPEPAKMVSAEPAATNRIPGSWTGSPVRPPEDGKANPMRLTVHLNAGIKLAALTSPHHDIVSDEWRDGAAVIRLKEDAVPADRDFELVWTPDRDAAPKAALFSETVGDDRFVMAMVMPPRPKDAPPPPPRDIVFVLDRSGSMDGPSIDQARKALVFALNRLKSEDRFDIIRFSHRTESLYGGLRPATAHNIRRGKAYVAATTADGGTEIRPALLQAMAGHTADGRLRQIVFLTDGAVGNETALLDDIATGIRDARFYTVGIGSAPNSYFMRRTAEIGRGSFTHIGNTENVAERMKALFLKIERPAMTGLKAVWSGLSEDAEVTPYPSLLPDLHDGEPVMLFARIRKPGAEPASHALSLSGRTGQADWRRTIDLASAQPGSGIGTLWARARIHDLMGTLHRGADPDSVRQAVTATALQHRVVSRYTSLIAIENRVARPIDEPLFSRDIARNLPDGWNFAKLFGAAPRQTASPEQKASLMRAPAAGGLSGRSSVSLPAGATDGPLQIALGIAALIAAAGMGLIWRRA